MPRRARATTAASPWPTLGVAGAILVALTPIVSHSFGRSTYGLLLPAMEDTLRLDHTQTGVGGTAIYTAYLVGVLVVASLARRCEPIAIMRGAVLVAAAGLLWMSTVHGLGAMVVGLFLCGGAGAGIWTTAPAILTGTVSAARRGLVIGSLTASVGLGTFVVGMGTSAARRSAGDELLWRPVWVVEAAVCVALLAGLVLFTRPPRTDRPVGGRFSLEQLRRVAHWPRITASYALFAAVGAGFTPFLVRALQNDAGLTKGGATVAFSTMSLLAIPGAPLLGLASDRWGRKPVMTVVLATAAVGTTVVAVGRGPVAVVGVFCFGAVWSSYPTLVATYVRDHTEARAFNEAFSTMTIFYSVAALGAPFTTGWLADRTGHFRTPFLLLAALCALGAALIARLPATVPGATAAGVTAEPPQPPAPAPLSGR
ncbi:MAG: MFS transporter [Acidimicrobiales bacterium]|nr:MFS transporter [Acidimicrobiales bacterium]